jgi:hypothetical protein
MLVLLWLAYCSCMFLCAPSSYTHSGTIDEVEEVVATLFLFVQS